MVERDVVVIGGGPAGLAAAIEAAKKNADVLLLDENIRAGGQLFKQIHKFFGSKAHLSGIRGIDIGMMLLEEAEHYGANAIVGVDVVYVMVRESMMLVSAYGTAVKIVKENVKKDLKNS